MDPKPVKVKTLPQLAKEIGLDRSTLVRMEQRGVISMAPIVNHPIQGRVYDAALEKKVKAEVARYLERKAAEQAGRPKAPTNIIVVDR